MNAIVKFLLDHPGQASAIVAVAALCISILSFILTILSLARQRGHDFLSVRPIAWISLADYENRVSVKVHNNGIGPLLVQKIAISDGHSAKGSLIEWMPDLPNDIFWNTFVQELEGRSLLPGREIVLLELTGNSTEASFREARDLCREHLKSLVVEVYYTDVYNRVMKPVCRNLSWFGPAHEIAKSARGRTREPI